MPSATKSRLRAELAQQRDVAGGPVAEAEVGADHDGPGVQRADEDPVDELLGVQPAISRSNGTHQHVVDAGLGEQRARLVDAW